LSEFWKNKNNVVYQFELNNFVIQITAIEKSS